MGNAALAGLRVLDLGDFGSGPYCARILGDLGAEVIKVEPPAGDSARRLGPFPDDVPSSEASGLFLYLNFNKLGITLDRSSAAGQRVLHSLLAESDVVVLNAALGGGNRFGLDVQELHARYPDLVLTCITPFGLVGKYADDAGYDINASAKGGASPLPREPGREPLMPPSIQIELLSGAGCRVRDRGGAHRPRRRGRTGHRLRAGAIHRRPQQRRPGASHAGTGGPQRAAARRSLPEPRPALQGR